MQNDTVACCMQFCNVIIILIKIVLGRYIFNRVYEVSFLDLNSVGVQLGSKLICGKGVNKSNPAEQPYAQTRAWVERKTQDSILVRAWFW